MHLKCIHELLCAGDIASGPVDMITQHQQKWLIANCFPRRIDCMAKPFLVVLDYKLNPLADFKDAALIFLDVRRQLIVIFDRNLGVKKGPEIVQVIFLNDDDDFFDPGLHGFFDNQ